VTAVIIPKERRPAPYAISHHSNVPQPRPEQPVNFLEPGDVIREIHYFYYFHDPLLSWDPMVVAEIKAFDPGAIPCFVKKVYRTPAGADLVLSYFAILREKRPTNGKKEWFRVIPCGCKEHRGMEPNVEEVVFSDTPPHEGWPESFIPCDARLSKRLKYIFWLTDKSVKDQAKEYLEARQAQQAKQEAAIKAETDARWDDDWGYIKRQVQSLSGPEIASMGQPQRRPESKPFVHHPKQSQPPPASPGEGV